jgi:hypothetical protein
MGDETILVHGGPYASRHHRRRHSGMACRQGVAAGPMKRPGLNTMPARRHHFVPQCYLKNFAVPRKKGAPEIVVFDRIGHKSYRQGINNVAFERDFNRVDVEGVDIDAFEKAMSKFETDLEPVLQRIIQAESLENQDDRATLLAFIGLLVMRNPRLRENIRGFHERVSKIIMDLSLATPQRWNHQVEAAKAAGYMRPDTDADYARMKAFIDGGRYKIKVSNNWQMTLEMGTFGRVVPLLFERRWVLIRAATDCAGFITSDHPVCLTWSEPKGRAPIGLGLRGTEILFPISPRLSVVGAFELEEGHADATPLMVAEMNGTIALFAERQVYARDMTFTYSFGEGISPRKASKLVKDRTFLRSQRRSPSRDD